jgi:exonuclease III
MGIRGFGPRHWRHDTLNCTDRTKPLNAWGIGLPQRELKRIKADPAIVAIAVQEAWNCGKPENLNSVLGFKTATRERNGVALIARHGLAGPETAQRIGGGGYDSWIVGGLVCLDANCSTTLPIFSTHWGAKDRKEWPIQAQHVIDFLKTQSRPHLFAGDLNIFRIDRWNPKVPCTNNDDVGRTDAIELLEHAGYIDAWKATQPGEGWTGMTSRPGCGSPVGNLFKRIDYVYSKQLRVVSTTQFARPKPGTDAPSDHVGLIAELAFPVSGTR